MIKVLIALLLCVLSTSRGDVGFLSPANGATFAKLNSSEVSESAGFTVRVKFANPGITFAMIMDHGFVEFIALPDENEVFQATIRHYSIPPGFYDRDVHIIYARGRGPDGSWEPLEPITVNLSALAPAPIISVDEPASKIPDDPSWKLPCTIQRFGAEILSQAVEYGTTQNYGQSAPLFTDPSTYINDITTGVGTVSGLIRGTTYHYRFVIQTRSGTFYGEDHQFQTPVNTPPQSSNQFGLLLNNANQASFDVSPKDEDGDNISIVSVTGQSWGTVTGTVYTAGPDFPGSDAFTVTITDGLVQSSFDVQVATSEWYLAKSVGSFESYIMDANLRPVGLLSATIRSNGALTGKFEHFGANYSFKGEFQNVVGDFPRVRIEVARFDNPPFVLDLLVAPSNSEVVGLAGNIQRSDTGTYTVVWSPPLAATTPTEALGHYNVIFPPEDRQTPEALPQGNGFSVMKIAKKGRVRWAGRSNDNTPFSFGGRYSINDTTLLFARINKDKRERIFGMVNPNNTEDIVWYKPERSFGSYAQGFSLSLSPRIERFEPLGAVDTIFDSETETSPPLVFSAFTHEGGVVTQKSLSASARYDSGKNSSERLKLKISRKTGIFSGEIGKGPNNATKSKVMGVILPKLRLGAGVWRKSGADAKVELRPVSDPN